VLMLRGGPPADCDRTRAGKDSVASPAMPPPTVRRNLRRPFSTLLFVMIWSPKIMDLVLGSTRLKMERTVLDDGAQGPCMETTRSDSLGAGGAENADARSSCVYVTPALAANSSPAAGRA
jgi:hypothetical protein